MLVIRQEQYRVFEQRSMRSFEDSSVKRISRLFRCHRAVLGEERLRGLVRLGLERAGLHGVTYQNTVQSYVDHMLMLGSHFDEDPTIPWARKALTHVLDPDQVAGMDRLHAVCMQSLDRRGGTNTECLRDAASKLRLDPVDDPVCESPEAQRALLADRLMALMPVKFAECGRGTVLELIARAQANAPELGLGSAKGVGIHARLMFSLGVGYIQDPQFHWAGESLSEREHLGPDAKAEALRSAGLGAMDAWLAAARNEGH